MLNQTLCNNIRPRRMSVELRMNSNVCLSVLHEGYGCRIVNPCIARLMSQTEIARLIACYDGVVNVCYHPGPPNIDFQLTSPDSSKRLFQPMCDFFLFAALYTFVRQYFSIHFRPSVLPELHLLRPFAFVTLLYTCSSQSFKRTS